jgi:phytol kinase
MFVVLTILFWKDSPIGMVALMMMCGGDGIADVIGRNIPSAKLPHSPNKSVAGSLGVFFGGLILSASVLFVYVSVGVFAAPFKNYLLPLLAIAVVATIIESLPHRDVDNITVTAASALIGWLMF